jgi:hypothetical protein
MWCSEDMATANIAFHAGFRGILTHHVEFITGEKPFPLGQLFARCKGLDSYDC